MRATTRVVFIVSILTLVGAVTPVATALASSGDSWTTVPDSASGDQGVSALDCYTATSCVALSGLNDDVFLSSNAGRHWTVAHSLKSLGQQAGLTCTSTGTCYLLSNLWTGSGGTIHYDGVAIAKSTNGGNRWVRIYVSKVPPEKGQYPTFSLSSISCPTSTTCFVIGGTPTTSFILKTTNGGGSWAKLPASEPFGALACPTTQVCYAVDGLNNSYVFKSTNGAQTWESQPGPSNFLNNPNYAPVKKYSLFTITCQSVTWCVAGGLESNISNSVATYPVVWATANGATWLFGGGIETSAKASFRKSYVPSDGLSCPAKYYCFAATSYGAVIDVTYINRHLEVSQDSASPTTTSQLNSLSCPTKTLCIDADVSNNFVPRFGVLRVVP